MKRPRKSEGRRRRKEIPVDIIPEILLRLPTKDFVRSSSVCKLWRSTVADPSFRKLHVAHHVAASPESSELLLVTETREPGRSDEASVFDLSSSKAMCHVAIPGGYSLAGVCNGFLCFSADHDQAPPVVCNPVTGDMLQLPKAPPLPDDPQLRLSSHLFILGFSAPTKEYKMFRLSFPIGYHGCRDERNYMAVYTLGGGGGWRQCSYTSRFHPVRRPAPAPVHIDGKLFVTTADMAFKEARAARMMVIDMATETRRSYRIPYNYAEYHESWVDMLADGFDLNGQMCLAVNAGFDPDHSREKVLFWVMKPPGELEDKDDDGDDELYWDLRYDFDFDDGLFLHMPRGAWIDDAQKLCYRNGDRVYKYDTRGNSSSSNVETLSFEQRVKIPKAPPSSTSSYDRLQFSRWNVCGGYRPSLLSPLIFALPPSQNEKGNRRPQLEHTVLRALTGELASRKEKKRKKNRGAC